MKMRLAISAFFLLFLGASCAEQPADEPRGLPPITPMKGTGELGKPEDPDTFTFVVFGDNRPGPGEPQPETIKEIFAEIAEMNSPRPAFALSLGDIIEGKDPQDPTNVIEKQFADFLALAAKAGLPIFNAPGNHETDDSKDVPSERMEKLYQENVGPLYGAFDFGNSRFICLNTQNIPPAGTKAPEPPLEFSYVSDEQLAELKADLEANKDKAHIFIAMHYPLHPQSAEDRLNPVDRKKMLDLLANYKNVSFVLAAHEHIYYNADDPENYSSGPKFTAGDDTIFLVSGGAGAPLYGDDQWHYHHFLIFHVDGEKIQVEIVKLQGSGAKS